MTVRRLHVPRGAIAGDRARLDPRDRHYLEGVLRLAPGAAVEVFDGEGSAWAGTLGEGEVRLGPRRDAPAPAAVVWLAFALARGEKNDLVVQKATELGVARLLPFQAERSVVKLDAARGRERAQRWQRIAEEAARQCGRSEVPAVDAPAALAEVLARAPAGFRALVLHPAAGEPFADACDGPAAGFLAVTGPEGGLTEPELEACLAAGARAATLGPRVLRAETAAVTVAALLQHRRGDLA
ncbi:16S rRNA (uracil(1498)-N(3))-methyltransferase [Anaeromyxobacter paludicola]|uniref:Ribosomal RNA small subunit methyltransferase E n=1 Tax=Anaeromyxobacter paludicola TaxID=2918171 RepID=A0ABN6NAV1_9BACT|nr:16S rRNA (uracil(1498)-N(3))-methyltransferase [Anaeromyxobacter paludicola]BDG09490.1 ribosomal RNA small subunit methyltransferase E [Anaeromyxobacter paludicola]